MTVWLCSGQGAQKPQMGADLLDLNEVSETFSVMGEILERDLASLAKEGTEDEINDTAVAQALTMAISVGLGRELKRRGFTPNAIVGFSLGQISALVLADILTLEEATQLLKVRSSSMAGACAGNPGGMLALMGANLQDAKEVCAQASGDDVLVCANHNAPGQIVISGHNEALERAQAIWEEAGNKSVRLNTAGAFHSPLMESAANEVETFCSSLNFKEPSVTLICNTDAKPFLVEEASKRLSAQVKGEVMFEESIRALLDEGEDDFVEVGFGSVLVNLVKRIDRSTNRVSVGKREKFDEYVGA